MWIHLRKEKFPSKCKSKLMPRSDGPFKILEKVSPNAYKVNLPTGFGVSATFDVADLSLYYDENEEILSLRLNSNLAGENDGDHQTKESNATDEVKEVQRSVNECQGRQGSPGHGQKHLNSKP